MNSTGKQIRLHLVAPAVDAHVFEFVECFTMPPITLLTLAALTPAHYSIAITDESVAPFEFQPCDLAAISVIYFTAEKAYAIADRFRERGIPVIIGGPHATLCPEETASHCDCVIIGEAEETWPAALRDFENGRLARTYREERKPSLENPPIPRYALVDLARYDVPHLVQTGRGCSCGCDFCAVPPLHGRVSRHKPVERVTGEIAAAFKASGRKIGRIVAFSDDNIANDPAYARELFEALIPMRLLWGSQCSLNIAYDDELLDLARRSGCRGLFIGFESNRQGALASVHKTNKPGDYPALIKKIRRAGIFVLGSFLFGLDGDTPDIFRRTVEFCEENGVDFVNFHIVSPTPGTRFFARLESEGRILHRRWRHYQENVSFRPIGMTIGELQQGQIWAYERFFRPAAVAKRIAGYWRSPPRMAAMIYATAKFTRLMRRGIAGQRRFLPEYNRDILRIDTA